MNTWVKKKLGELVTLEYGKSLTTEKRITGQYPVYGSSGNVGSHSDYLVKCPGIIIGRKDSVGEIYYIKNNYYPIDTVYFIRNKN